MSHATMMGALMRFWNSGAMLDPLAHRAKLVAMLFLGFLCSENKVAN